MIVDLEWDDNGQYFCSIYDSNGNQIGKTKTVAILSLKTGIYIGAGLIPTRDLKDIGNKKLVCLIQKNS